MASAWGSSWGTAWADSWAAAAADVPVILLAAEYAYIDTEGIDTAMIETRGQTTSATRVIISEAVQ